MDAPVSPPAPLPESQPPERPFNVGRLVGSIFVVIGVALLALAGYIGWQEQAFLTRAMRTRGLVVALTTRWGGTNGSSRRSDRTLTYAPTFTFADQDGKEHRVRSHSSANPPSHRVGENVDVLYDPTAPDHAQIRGFFAQWGAATICGGLGGLFSLIGGSVAWMSASGATASKIYMH